MNRGAAKRGAEGAAKRGATGALKRGAAGAARMPPKPPGLPAAAVTVPATASVTIAVMRMLDCRTPELPFGRPISMFVYFVSPCKGQVSRTSPSIETRDVSHQGLQPQRLHSKAGYMAASERFAERPDSSCIAGALHTRHITTFRCGANVLSLLGVKRTLRGRPRLVDVKRLTRSGSHLLFDHLVGDGQQRVTAVLMVRNG